jgi:aspartyl-tRNA(Asn)/glutamyl-tRNA(Gln) amidotransferase subunit A
MMVVDVETLAGWSAVAIGRALAAGAADPVALAEHCLAKIAADPEPVFITVTNERALAEARAAWARLRAGRPLSALDGVPIAWKDLVDIAGTPTTAASAIYRDSPVKNADAPVASLAAASGMVCLGKVNLTEFAYSGLGLNPHFGTPANAHGRSNRRAPGGSSSGSAVAVASGLVPVAIGTDTGGSIRVPASFNGLVGYKATYGRIDKTGVFDLAPSLDSVGPFTRTVEDCIVVEMVLRGAVTSGVRRQSLAGVRLVVPTGVFTEEVDAPVAASFAAALAALEAAGAVIERRRVAPLERFLELTATHGSLVAAEAYRTHHRLIDVPDALRIDRRVTARILGGKRLSGFDVLTLSAARTELAAELRDLMGDGLLVMPTTPHVAPAIAPLEADDDLFHAVNLRTLRNTMPANFLGMCSLALPSGWDPDGMPTSFMTMAPGGADERLLGLGLEIEGVLQAGRG